MRRSVDGDVGKSKWTEVTGEPATKPLKEDGTINDIKAECEALHKIITSAYEEGVTLPEAEKLAARFLGAQMMISEALAVEDLNARMSKNGYKTMRAKVYLDTVQASDKKPTEAQIAAQIDTDSSVATAQNVYERSESRAEALQRYFEIFRDGHIYMRGIAKGKYE